MTIVTLVSAVTQHQIRGSSETKCLITKGKRLRIFSHRKWIIWIIFSPNNHGRNCGAWALVLVIRRYLKFTAPSERELSVHPCCLHSFYSERWTWTSGDRTQVSVYLSPFLSSWEFALHPDRKPLASPLSVSSLLFTAPSAVEQQAGYYANKVRAVRPETTKPQDANDVTFNSTAGGEQTKGQYLWKNAYHELERLSIMLSTINLFSERLTLILNVTNAD